MGPVKPNNTLFVSLSAPRSVELKFVIGRVLCYRSLPTRLEPSHCNPGVSQRLMK
jgi:hypothetical protein